jgi:hypothetical protein
MVVPDNVASTMRFVDVLAGRITAELPRVSEARTLRVGPRSEGTSNGYASVVHAYAQIR